MHAIDTTSSSGIPAPAPAVPGVGSEPAPAELAVLLRQFKDALERPRAPVPTDPLMHPVQASDSCGHAGRTAGDGDGSPPSCPADLVALAKEFSAALRGKPVPLPESPFASIDGHRPGSDEAPLGRGSTPHDALGLPGERQPRTPAAPLGFSDGPASNRTDWRGDLAARSDHPVVPPEAPEQAKPSRTEPTVRPEQLLVDEQPSPESVGAAVLQSFLQQSANAALLSAPVAASTPAAAPSLVSLVAETVTRVLVSDPLHDGNREIRVQLAQDVLPDTEVRMWREAGRLHIEFSSPPAVAEGGLRDALPRLPQAIQQRQLEAELPVVTLQTSGADSGSHPQDGRARQQYVRISDEEERA